MSPEDDQEAWAIRRRVEHLRTPPAPAWLTTKLTAAYRRRHGALPPVRELRLEVVADSDRRVAGVRGSAGDGERTLHLRAAGERSGHAAAPEVVVDVRPAPEGVDVDLLVLRGRGLAYHARATTAELVRDAEHSSADGRVSFRGLPAGLVDLLLDDGHDRLRAALDLSRGNAA